MKLGLIADTQHYLDEEGRVCALTPVVRQLDLWADWFPEMVICAPLLPGPPPPTHTPYQRLKVSLRPLTFGGGDRLWAKIGLIGRVLEWWPRVRAVIREVDAVHLRCPCNIGLVGILALRGTRKRRYAMYAGQWSQYPGQPFFSRMQQRLLASPSFGGPVAIYGSWPGQADHLFTSFSPSFTSSDWEEETDGISDRLERLAPEGLKRVRLVTVGHLDGNKGQRTVLEGVSILKRRGMAASLQCVGSGPALEELTALSRSLDVEDCVEFLGRQPYAKVREAYRNADFNVLASLTEGYPKVLAEGMLHGAIPIASDIGINSQIVGEGRRGATFPFQDAKALADAVIEIGSDTDRMRKQIVAGRDYTRDRTLEAFQELHRQMLEKHWQVSLPVIASTALLSGVE